MSEESRNRCRTAVCSNTGSVDQDLGISVSLLLDHTLFFRLKMVVAVSPMCLFSSVSQQRKSVRGRRAKVALETVFQLKLKTLTLLRGLKSVPGLK